MSKKENVQRGLAPSGELGFWLRPTWPQCRKIVNGKEKCLDGTETAKTEIVKYDYNENYKKWRDVVLKEAMKKPAAKKPNTKSSHGGLKAHD